MTDKVLKVRFDCKKSHSSYGMKLEPTSLIIDIESLGKSKEFIERVKYINTNKSSQLKGAGGFAK